LNSLVGIAIRYGLDGIVLY